MIIPPIKPVVLIPIVVVLILFVIGTITYNLYRVHELLRFSWEMKDTHPIIHDKLDRIECKEDAILSILKDLKHFEKEE